MVADLGYALAAKVTAMFATTLAPVFGAGWSDAKGGGRYNVDTAISKGADHARNWVGSLIIILGAAAIGIASYKLVTGLASQGKKEVNWVLVILLYAVGGMFVFGGIGFVSGTLAGNMFNTVETWTSS